MSEMIQGLKILYKKSFERRLTLFSICGIVGLFNGYLNNEQIDSNEITLINKILFCLLFILFTYVYTGLEIQFLRERKFPDLNIETFKIMTNKIPFFVFLFSVPILICNIFTNFSKIAFIIEAILAVPLTIIQSGFSYHLDNNDATMLFKNFKVTQYISLFFKRIWLIVTAYITTGGLVFSIFFIIGIILVSTSDIDILTIVSNKTIITKLSNYVSEIILVYTLALATFVWDYELIKTCEKNNDMFANNMYF